MLKHVLTAAALVSLAVIGATNAQQTIAPPGGSGVKRTPLQRVDVPGTNMEVIFAMAELPGGFMAGRHAHPGSVMAYVIDGEFKIVFDGQGERTFKPGESLQVPSGAAHDEGASGDKPAKLIAVYVVEKGKPLASPAQ